MKYNGNQGISKAKNLLMKEEKQAKNRLLWSLTQN